MYIYFSREYIYIYSLSNLIYKIRQSTCGFARVEYNIVESEIESSFW